MRARSWAVGRGDGHIADVARMEKIGGACTSLDEAIVHTLIRYGARCKANCRDGDDVIHGAYVGYGVCGVRVRVHYAKDDVPRGMKSDPRGLNVNGANG